MENFISRAVNGNFTGAPLYSLVSLVFCLTGSYTQQGSCKQTTYEMMTAFCLSMLVTFNYKAASHALAPDNCTSMAKY